MFKREAQSKETTAVRYREELQVQQAAFFRQIAYSSQLHRPIELTVCLRIIQWMDDVPDDSARASVVATLPGCTAVLLQCTATQTGPTHVQRRQSQD